MNWLDTTQQIITLITGLAGLASGGIGIFFAVRSWIKALKTKSASEIWELITTTADSAIKSVENSAKTGAEKKEAVIEAVKEACKTAGIDCTSFLDQLSSYIDQTITFVNGFIKKDDSESK